MSYCSFSALKILLKNYLNYEEDDLDSIVLNEIKDVIDKAKMTPADVSELLIKNRRCKNRAVTELLETLKSKAEKNEKNSGELRKKEMGLEEEEEQEKRTLDSPKEGSEFEEEEEDCRKETEEEEDDDHEKNNNFIQ